jgi:hypothetical protein
MILVAGSIALSGARSTGLCTADPNYLMCFRQWVNAASNFAAVLVAVIALVIAWGQLKANAVMAALPAINQRIIGGKATVIVGRQLTDHIVYLSNLLSMAIDSLENGDFTKGSLSNQSKNISTCWTSTFGDATQIRAIADDVHDIDLENELSAIIQTGLQLQDAGLPIIGLFRRLLDAERVEESLATTLYGTTSVNLAIIDITKSLREIRDFVEVCRVKLNELAEIDGRLVHLVQDAKETRLNLLQIIGTPRSNLTSR